jgi:hypothetical protein
MAMRLIDIGGPTPLIRGRRMEELTDPTFDPPGETVDTVKEALGAFGRSEGAHRKTTLFSSGSPCAFRRRMR